MLRKNSKTMTFLSRKNYLGLVFKTILLLICMATRGDGARIKRAVMMKMDMTNFKCQESSITESNLTSSVILTATVKRCGSTRKTSYSCEVQIWRIMKGKDLAGNLTKVIKQGTSTLVTYQTLATVYGLGNSQYCHSEIKVDNTRIFFLNRINDRLVLSSSILRITLLNLKNTQKVIQGTSIEEPEKKPVDPCIDVLCGFKATCQVTADNQPTCVCPDFECGKSNVFAPVCGSDGVTYASECRLLASQCWKQSRIRVASQKACAPVTDDDPCKQVDCGNSASCVVSVLGGLKTALCECPTCENVPTRPVCGSDQTSHRTECNLRRTACLSGQDILLVRRSACNPCEVYNEATSSFDLLCIGPCSLDANDHKRCCTSITCTEDEMSGVICANDGRTYKSVCAMKKQACRTAKTIEKFSDSACVQKDTTTVRGSVSIAADEQCPGGCDPTNTEFIEFRNNFEKLVNEQLVKKNSAADDDKVLSEFKINEIRTGSSVLVYSAHMSTSNDAIDEDHIPGSESLWAFLRLHDPASGAVVVAASTLSVNFVDYRDPLDDFYSEDVCENIQCDYGSACSITVDASGNNKPECKCDGNGNPNKLPVTHACKRADNGRIYVNNAAVHTAECSTHHYFTFKDLCRDPPTNPCDTLECPTPGTSCVVTNEAAVCECKTCEEVYQPVCGSNDQTYKSECELQRYNCLNGLDVVIKSQEACGSPCDTVDCGLKQCIETPQGSAVCTCPESCLEVKSPVCGSDGEDYDNECLLTVEACKSQVEITVAHPGTCSSVPKGGNKPSGGDEFEGSGEANECGCHYEATCETTIDDEDAGCICNFDCADEPVSKVCGSDGRTYDSDCARRKTQCEAQAFISLSHTGACAGCSDSIYGCCEDGVTSARGPLAGGCPENCGCNPDGSFDLTCHPVTRQCSCKPGISGLTCNRCEPGYWNFQAVVKNNAKGCMSCQCHPDGSIRDDCDQMTGHCVCKPDVIGPKCSKCIDTGAWPTKTGCAKPMPDVMSCDDLNCQSNQNCVNSEDGKFSCECPLVESCDNGKQMLVCGTNGMTYSSECLMRVITCRSGVDVQVQSQGTCKDFVKANEKLEKDKDEDVDLVIPDLVDVDGSTVAPTTITTTTTYTLAETTEMITTTEMSGEEIKTTSELPPDDEDSMKENGSGDEMDMVEPKKIITPTSSDQSCNLMGQANFKNTDGMDSSVFEQNPEMASEYKSDMEDQMLQIMKHVPNLPNPVEAVKIQELNMNGSVMSVKFHLTLTPDSTSSCNSEIVKTSLNSMPKGDWGEIMITDADDEAGAIDKTVYYESSTWPSLPQFGGASYAEFKELQSTNIAVMIEVDFRTFDSEGVILYSGQTKQPARDFISLSINNGRVEFRFDTGSGPLVLRSERRVDDGMFHKIVIRRNRKYGMLKVDDDAEVTDSAQGNTHGVDLDSHLYIGGFPNTLTESVSKDVDVRKGLTGCISQIYIVPSKKNLNYSLFDTIPRDFHRLAECRESPCNLNPCQNSANCFITKQQEKFTYKCLCSKNYKGEHCEKLSQDVGACSSSPCHEYATCMSDPATPENYTCACPPSRKGRNCEILEEDDNLPFSPLYMPGFAGDSYIEHESLSSIAKHKLDVTIIFYSMQPDGLLFYNGQKKSGKGEFVSLNLREGYLEFIYDLGDGPATLRSTTMISLYEWHEVRASRNGRSGSLVVDNNEAIVGESPVKSTQLNVEQSLYIGGVPDFSRVARAASITTGLNGALQKFVINGEVYEHLMDDALSTYNVRAFTGHVCYRQPCKNDGMCIPNMGEFSCKCPIGYSGSTCQIVNKNEEKMLQDQGHDTIRFNGKTSLRYLNHIHSSDLSVLDNYFEIELKTTSENGLILHVGHSTSEGDYLALGLNDGRLHLRFDLGSGSAFIESERVNDGRWKIIKVTRERHEATLQINDEPALHLSAPPFTNTLNSNGILWLGGSEDLPKNERGFPKSFLNNYQGCIGMLKVRRTLVHLREDSLDAVWLPTCTSRKK